MDVQPALTASASVGFLFWRASVLWQRAVGVALKPLDINHVQFVLLASVGWLEMELGRNPSQRELSDHAKTDPMMTSTVLRTLEKRGLVGRISDPTDARVWRVLLTATGKTLTTRAQARVERLDSEFFGRGKSIEQVVELLAPLAEISSD